MTPVHYLAASWILVAQIACATTYTAGPNDYRTVLGRLGPGDTLSLQAGVYRSGLRLHGMHGDERRPIVIHGPRTGPQATLIGQAGANTISLADSSYITVTDLTLDGAHLPVDAVKAEYGRPVHHITLARLRIVGYDAAQDVIGISTKSPAWGWVIRDSTIVGAGTGMYLGNSDGTAPFIAGLIEGNVIVDSIGYNIEIKHQLERPAFRDGPATPSTTRLHNNIFVKTRPAVSAELARPNVLLGHLPLQGEGHEDHYEVVGNIFYDNPSEALFQGEGNLVLEHNIFINPHGDAVVIQPHHDRPRDVRMARNFVVAQRTGVRMRGGDPTYRQEITGNVILAGSPIEEGSSSDNTIGAFEATVGPIATWAADEAQADFGPVEWGPLQQRLCAHPSPDESRRYVASTIEVCSLLRRIISSRRGH